LFVEEGKLLRENPEDDVNPDSNLIKPNLLVRMITTHHVDRNRMVGKG
jgi:hypothetical protein